MSTDWTPPELAPGSLTHRDAALRRVRGDRWFLARWLLLVVAAVVVATIVGRARLRPRVTIVGPGGAMVQARLVLFALDRSPSGPSPTAEIGHAASEDADEIWIDAPVGEEGCLARVHAEGLGLGVALIEPTGISPRVKLAPAPRVRGRVFAVGGMPVAGARVLVLGGGPRGVPMVTKTTDAEGEFEIVEISPTVSLWHFRVTAPGYALGAVDWNSDQEDEPRIVLKTTRPARGRLVCDEDIPLGDLSVRGYHLPGLSAVTERDGTFAFDAAPPVPTEFHPVVDGLPDDFTYALATMQAGHETTIRVVRGERIVGRVVDAITGRPVGDARVFHENGPRCIVATRTAPDGTFELPLAPLGSVEVRAVLDRHRRNDRSSGSGMVQGVEVVDVQRGGGPASVLVRVE